MRVPLMSIISTGICQLAVTSLTLMILGPSIVTLRWREEGWVAKTRSSFSLLRCVAESREDEAIMTLKMKYSPANLLSLAQDTSGTGTRKSARLAVRASPLPHLDEEIPIRQRLVVFVDAMMKEEGTNMGTEEHSQLTQPPKRMLQQSNLIHIHEESSMEGKPLEEKARPEVQLEKRGRPRKNRIISMIINQSKGKKDIDRYEVSYGEEEGKDPVEREEAGPGPSSVPSDHEFIHRISSSKAAKTKADLISNVVKAFQPRASNLDHRESRAGSSTSNGSHEPARKVFRITSQSNFIPEFRRGYKERLDMVMEQDERKRVERQGRDKGEDDAHLLEEKVLVVAEQVSRFLGASIPPKAFTGWRAVELSSLLELDENELSATGMPLKNKLEGACGLWLDTCGPDFARRFVEREPTFLLRHPRELLTALECFCQVFDLTPNECIKFALRNTALVKVSQDKIRATIEEVMSIFELSEPESCRLVIKHTELITSQEGWRGETLRERVNALELLLPVTRSKIVQILNQRPMLLTNSAVKNARMIVDLSTILDMPLFNVAAMAAAEPNLLCLSKGKVETRWRRLVELTEPEPEWRAQLSRYSPFQLARCLCASDGVIERLAILSRLNLASTRQASSIKWILCCSEARFLEAFPLVARIDSERSSRDRVSLDGFETARVPLHTH
jgi:hypothetical protein